MLYDYLFFFSSRRRHTRCALVTGVQTCALPILRRFDLNGLILPASERAAIECGHALHRGPHHGYSDVVAARVECVRAHFAVQAAVDPRAARRTAVMRLRLLQGAPRRALTDRDRKSVV